MNSWRLNGILVSVAMACAMVGQAESAVITTTFPEVNGDFYTSGFPLPEVVIATTTFSMPASEEIDSATFSGTFGRTSTYLWDSTAHHQLFLNGFLIADTTTVTPDPYSHAVPFSLTLTDPALLSSLASGQATLSYIQTSEYNVRLSATRLQIHTAASPVDHTPEPTALAVWGTLGGLGMIAARRRKRRV